MGNTNGEDFVSYLAFESCEMRSERRDKRKDRIIVLLIIGMILEAVLFYGISAYERLQYDYASESSVVEQNAEDGGNANFIGNDGVIE